MDPMTDLLIRRPVAPADPPPITGGRSAAWSALLAGLGAAGSPLAVIAVLALTGWYTSANGSLGAPRTAMRVAGDAWLMAHGSGLQVGSTSLTFLPLGLTLLSAVACWRWGRRAGARLVGVDDRGWGLAAATMTAVYVVVVVVVGVLCSLEGADPSVGRAVMGGGALAAVLGGAGLAVGSGRSAVWATRLPADLAAAIRGAALAALSLLALSALLLAGQLIRHAGEGATLLSRWQADPGDAVVMTAAVLAVVPNAILLTTAYLAGPGFVLGTGTLVSPTLVETAELPAFPLLAALPADGAPAGWVGALTGLPAVAGALGAVLAHRVRPTADWVRGPLRGLAGGVLAGAALGVSTALAGGAVGPGRMADVGAPALAVALTAAAAMGLGGVLAGSAMTWRTRRTTPEAAPDAGPEAAPEAEDPA